MSSAPSPLPIPTIVCLCGSTRFYQAFMLANYQETLNGRIVLSVGFFAHVADQAHGGNVGITPDQKAKLDRLHLAKIDLADEVLILNVGDYIGLSTRREAWYAARRNKQIRFLEKSHLTGQRYGIADILSWFDSWEAWERAGVEAANPKEAQP